MAYNGTGSGSSIIAGNIVTVVLGAVALTGAQGDFIEKHAAEVANLDV